MNVHRALACFVLVMVGVCAFLGASSAFATTQAWREMRPNSFPATPAAARSQCEAELNVGTVPGLTASMCVDLERKLIHELCHPVLSNDGDQFYAIGGVGAGYHQALGFAPHALECHLGPGVTVRWFTGEAGRSCNNVGFLAQSVAIPLRRSESATYTLPPFVVQVAPIEPCTCGVVLPGFTAIAPGGTYTTFEDFGTFGVRPSR